MIRLLLFFMLLTGCPAPEPPPADPSITWTCSMHPQVHEDHAGPCPICGMDLVPEAVRDPDAAVSVQVDPRIRAAIGMRTQPVTRTTLFRHLSAVGEVVPAEDAVAHVTLRTEAWVDRLLVGTTGATVTAGQILLFLDAPSLTEAQHELILATGTRRDAARSRLRTLGIAARDIDAVIERGSPGPLPLRAPRSGTVIHLGTAQGDHLPVGHTAYTIADLSHVWVEAHVYESDAPWVEPGQPATIRLRDRSTPITTSVAFIHPTLDPMRRTLRVRLEVDAPLRPGDLADVQLGYRHRDDVIAIPKRAVLETGRRAIVFVHEGDGHFTPREVDLGLQGDRGMIEVTHGLDAGESIALDGRFLLDAEVRLQEGLQALTGPDEPTHFACPMHPEQAADHPGQCAICGMDYEPVTAEIDP